MSDSGSITAAELTRRLKAAACGAGFVAVGTCRAVSDPPGFETEPDSETDSGSAQDSGVMSALASHRRTLLRFREWLDGGHAATMRYLADRREAYRTPDAVLPGARSFLVLAAAYRTVRPAPPSPGTARVATYAWGDDYHDVLRRRMRELIRLHRTLAPTASVRGCVDTAPLFEKELARRAGIGRIGKNTLLIHPDHGTRLLLAVLVSTAEFEYDETAEPFADPCDGCDACVRSCPTGALRPYRLDARRCLSYRTIESRGPVPAGISLGDRLFGCETCQDCCPWNAAADACRPPADTASPPESWPESLRPFLPRGAVSTADPAFSLNPVHLSALRSMDDATLRRALAGSPLLRPGLESLRRNAEESGAIAAPGVPFRFPIF